MERLKIIGIDPGLVHTGVVSILFDPSAKMVDVDYLLVNGIKDPALQEVADWTNDHHPTAAFIEAYRPRSNFSVDSAMGAAVNQLKRLIPRSVTLDNSGVTKVVKRGLMNLLQVWTFPKTHHQDLRSAARIGLYGALRSPEWNSVVSAVVIDQLAGKPWQIIRKDAP